MWWRVERGTGLDGDRGHCVEHPRPCYAAKWNANRQKRRLFKQRMMAIMNSHHSAAEIDFI